MVQTRRASKEEQIVSAAFDLFYAEGFHATGVEKIREAANVSKKTLYAYFKTKDDLIEAVLRKRAHDYYAMLVNRAEASDADPLGKLYMMFDALEDWFTGDKFFGCMFNNGVAEFSQRTDPRNQACAEAKHMVKDYIVKQLNLMKIDNIDTIADQWCVLIEGAIVMAHVYGDNSGAQTAKKMAKSLFASLEKAR